MTPDEYQTLLILCKSDQNIFIDFLGKYMFYGIFCMFVAFHFTERCLEEPLLDCITIDTPVWVGIWVHLRFLVNVFVKKKLF